jgi:hypothetical protein
MNKALKQHCSAKIVYQNAVLAEAGLAFNERNNTRRGFCASMTLLFVIRKSHLVRRRVFTSPARHSNAAAEVITAEWH